MHCDYKDIIDKLGKPLWWDENAVPRYCEFAPDLVANIYAKQVALLEIACQHCGYRFNVAMSSRLLDQVKGWPSLAECVVNKRIYYGDPPNYGCCAPGPTMTSDSLEVLEFWTRDYITFERKPEFEISLEIREEPKEEQESQ